MKTMKALNPLAIAATVLILAVMNCAPVFSAGFQASAVESSSELLAQRSRLQIDWGDLGAQFNVYSPKVEKLQYRDALGNRREYWAMTFTVEAKEYFTPYGYYAYFYDADGIEIDMSTVEFAPDYGAWSAGTRSRANIVLPDMSQVAFIKFVSL
jgi:hypothetical protein